MKIKFLALISLIPTLGNAHTGHPHNAKEILLTPSMWMDHLVILSSIGFLFALLIWKVLIKYYPSIFKMIRNNSRIHVTNATSGLNNN